tara:strand:+ start:2598 stop:3527 length:930 start_codon:yes stop_codon:yes gene_type:complete
MAKKLKQKKTGMVRRQQIKRHKKKIRRRLLMPSRRQKIQESPEKIEQILAALPKLAFEPEMNDLKMNPSELKLLLEKNLAEIDIFSQLLTDSFINELKSRLANIVETNPEKSINSILAKVTQHQIENKEDIPYISNPLLIAIFLKTKAFLVGEDLSLDNLHQAMEAFNIRNENTLSALSENFPDNGRFEKNKIISTEPKDNESNKTKKPIIEKSVYKKFIELFPKQKQQRIEDDLEVFLVDFQPPPLAKWNRSIIENFIGKWFVENANPMEEDLVSMRESLLALFKFLYEEKLISKTFITEVSSFLEKK